MARESSCQYRVSATYAIGTGSFSNTATVSGADVPDAPTGLTPRRVRLQWFGRPDWTAPWYTGGRAVTNYVIQRDTGSGYGTIATIGNTTSYTDNASGCAEHLFVQGRCGQHHRPGRPTALAPRVPARASERAAEPHRRAGNEQRRGGPLVAAADVGYRAGHALRGRARHRSGFARSRTLGNVRRTPTVVRGSEHVQLPRAAQMRSAEPYSTNAQTTGADVPSAPADEPLGPERLVVGRVDLSWNTPSKTVVSRLEPRGPSATRVWFHTVGTPSGTTHRHGAAPT